MKCKYETSNGRCGLKGSYAYRHKCYTDEFCKCCDPQTNADRIRAMSDEELAEFLEDETWMCESYDVCHECPRVEMSGDCVSVLGWLKLPVKDGEGE